MARTNRPALQTVSLHEDVVTSGKLTVDRDQGVLRGVKILGTESANGRTYTPQAIKAAAKLYEGAFVNRDHPQKPTAARSADDRLGWLEGVRVEADGLYGDLHYLTSHPFAARLAEAAERRPGAFGLSHNAQGKGKDRNGKFHVEHIVSVKSVDLVADPASTKGLFEEYKMEPEMVANGDAGGSPEEKLKDGFKAAIMAVVDDDSMDTGAKISKIREYLKMHEKATAKGGGGSEGSSGGGDSEESPAAEGIVAKAEPTLAQLQEQIAATQRQLTVRALCDAAGLIPSAVQFKALVALTEESDQKDLVEQFKAQKTAASNGHVKAKSVSARQLSEAKDADNKMPADAKAFAERLTARRR